MGNEAKDPVVSGVITYPCKAPAGHQSGRRLDDGHWQKIQHIFPKQFVPKSKKEELLLDDSSEKKPVQVLNGRMNPPSLDKEGFTLLQNLPAIVADLGNDASVQQLYLPQVVEAVMKVLPNAKAVVPFHSVILDSRRDNYDSSKGERTFNGNSSATVSRVHGDYTTDNAPLRFEELKAKGLLDKDWDSNKEHWGIMNVWRNVCDDPVATKPLTLLDVRSRCESDVFQYWLVNQDRVGKNLALSYNKDHRWMYFPRMTNSEALLFFTFECNGESPTEPRLVFHTAFDPILEASSKGKVRAAMATRCLVVFDK